MYTIDNNDLFVMLNNFYSTYFVDYLFLFYIFCGLF